MVNQKLIGIAQLDKFINYSKRRGQPLTHDVMLDFVSTRGFPAQYINGQWHADADEVAHYISMSHRPARVV